MTGHHGIAKILVVIVGCATLLAGTTAIAADATLSLDKGAGHGEIALSWTGGAPEFGVYRSDDPAAVLDPANRIAATVEWSYDDVPPAGGLYFYKVDYRATCLRPNADTYADSTIPDSPLFADPYLVVGTFIGNQITYLRFSLDTIPAGATIRQAVLWMDQWDSTAGGMTTEIVRIVDPWNASELTWGTRPATDGTTYSAVTQDDVDGRKAWTVTSLVQEWIDGTPNHGLAMQPRTGAALQQWHPGDKKPQLVPRLCIDWAEPQAAALEDLRAMSEVDPRVRFGDNGIAETAETTIGMESSEPVEAALLYLDRFAAMYGLQDPYEELFVDRIVQDGNDWSVIFGRRHQGAEVLGRQILVSMDVAEGAITGTSASYQPGQPLYGDIEFGAREAVERALEAIPDVVPEVMGDPRFEWFDLALQHPGEASELVPAWRVGLRGFRPTTESHHNWVAYVDARNGDILRTLMDDQSADRPGENFDIETANNTESSSCWNGLFETSDDEWFDEDGTSGYPGTGSDPFLDGQDANTHTHGVYHYYYDAFGRESWDNDGEQVEVMVHVGNNLQNAYYSRGCDHMAFGDGYVTADVFGHEFTHAVVRWTSELKYENQPGALNESLADTFGAFYDGDWEIGEGVVTNNNPPLRDMADPPVEGDPDHVDPAISGDGTGQRPDVTPVCDVDASNYNDCGWVHSNSGIPNKVAYLITEGGSHNGLNVNLLGRSRAEKLYYVLTLRKLHKWSRFQHARDESVKIARKWWLDEKNGFDAVDTCGVINAWASVGIGDADTDCDGYEDAEYSDTDGDGALLRDDNCPQWSNPTQSDIDGDGIGDVCDPDMDDDGIDNDVDNCPVNSNPPQADTDGDGIGDQCEDRDADGVRDLDDNCEYDVNPDQTNTDGDGEGDACDTDDDNDGEFDWFDNCPLVNNTFQQNSDSDSHGDACDNCNFVANEDQANHDRDGLGDACDSDDDNDGVLDGDDNCPITFNPDQVDSDNNGVGLFCDAEEQRELDGAREAAEYALAFEHLDPGKPIRIPIQPCGADLCPDWLDPWTQTTVDVTTNPPYGARIVDDRGFSYSKASFDAGGAYRLQFRPDAEFFYRDAVHGEPFQGRKYYLELMAQPGTGPTEVTGTITVQTVP